MDVILIFKQQDGDWDQHLNKMKFNGEKDFIGEVNSPDSEVRLYPANAPILNFNVVLGIIHFSIKRLKPKY